MPRRLTNAEVVYIYEKRKRPSAEIAAKLSRSDTTIRSYLRGIDYEIELICRGERKE